MASIAQWLAELGMPQYIELFVRNEIDVDVLPELTDADLIGLGLPVGARRRILKAIAAFAPGVSPSVRSSASLTYTPSHVQSVLVSRSSVEGERKQVTVLFCDIVGSTLLAQQLGEERMHALLNRFFELAMAQVHRYEGTINQFLGDGFMALLGAPVAHEDHALRGVLTALDIRHALHEAGEAFRGLQLRMGINTGLVVVGRIGDNLRTDYTAIGDTTNIAARLQQHAEPGAILISDATLRLVQGYVRTEGPLPMLVKGKSEPVLGHKLIGRGARKSPLEGRHERPLARFVGREREMQTLAALLPDVEVGRGQIVGIVGEPGVGKSRVLYEFRQLLDARRFGYLEARCLSYGAAMPYLPILDLLRSICGIVETDPQATVAAKVRSVLGTESVDEAEVPYLLLLLGVHEGTGPLRDMSPETVKARTLQALTHLFLEESQRQPLVLAIEDLHWVDCTSEEWLSGLAGSIAGAPVLLLGTHRPGYRPPWMEQSYATQLALPPLSSTDSQAVVASTLTSGAVAEDLLQSIVRKGDGNPFFLEELARSVAERGSEGGRLDLPDTVQGVLLARIDQLPESAKPVLQSAAVLGREAPLRLLREIYEATETLDADLRTLKHQEFLFERVERGETTLVFKHVLTQEAAYDSLLTGRRQVLHEAAGRAVERLNAGRLEEHYERLAYHYERSANTHKAFEYLARANDKAMKSDAPIEAKGYFERAMALLDTLPDDEINRRRRLELLASQIVLFQNLFQMREYFELLTRYEPVAHGLNDAALLGPIVQQLGHCDWTFGRFADAHRRFEQAAPLLEAAGNYGVAAQTYEIWMWNHLCLGNFQDVLSLEERMETAWKRQPNLRWYVYALCADAVTYGYLGRFREALATGHKALAVAESFQDAAQMSFAGWSVGLTYLMQGDLDRAVEYGELGVAKAPTPAERAWAAGCLAAAQCRAGQFEEALAVLAPLFSGLRGSAFVPGERFAPFLGEAYLGAARYEEGRQALEEGLAIHLRHGMRYEAGQSYRLMGEWALLVNPGQINAPLAEPYLDESRKLLGSIHALPDLARAYSALGRLRISQQRWSEASEALHHSLQIFQEIGVVAEPDRLNALLSNFPQ